MEINLINQDCIVGIKQIQDESVDLIFCDLPYGITNCEEWDHKLDLKKLSKELLRIAKDYCTIIFTCKFKFGLEIMEAMGKKYFRYDMVWKKRIPTTCLNSNRMPLPYHENILVFYKKSPKHIYKENKNLYHKAISKIKDGTKNLNNNTVGKCILKNRVLYSPKLPGTVLEYQESKRGNTNQTQKPVGLIEFFIKYYTKEGALVLDPTFGSGTTAVACMNLNRKFIGFEMNTEQYNNAVNRIKNLKIKQDT
jgi:site-specific DNA-methyltransferase (adenine-specific)